MKEEYEKLSNEERQVILEKEGTLLSEDEWAEIDRRFNSPMGQMIAAFGSRMPRINKRADGNGLCKVHKPAATSSSLWHGEDSRLACLVDGQIEKAIEKTKRMHLCR